MKKKYLKAFLIIFLIIFLMILFIYAYLSYVRNSIYTNTLDNLNEVVKQDAAKINNKLIEDIQILNNISKQITNLNEEDIFKIYNNLETKNNFARMAIMYENGSTITSDGEIIDLSDEIDYFFASDEVQVSRSRKSKVDMEEINIYSKKIKLDNISIVIMLIAQTEQYERLFDTSIYNGRGYEYIITNSGEIIVNSAGHENIKDIFKELKENLDTSINFNKGKIELIQENILNNISGDCILKIYNHYYYISYTNISINDWNLLIIIPEDIVTEGLSKTINIISVSSFSLIFLIIIISSYIILSNIKKKEKLYNLAYIDKLTNLGNYYYFCKEGEILINNENNSNSMPLYVIIFDIEKFRSFNKHYGHNVGDKLIYQIANVINTCLQDYNKIISRFSNDIFAILINTNDIDSIAKKIFYNINQIKIDEQIYKIYPIIGIYNIKSNDSILEAIDKAQIAHDEIVGNYNVIYNLYSNETEEKILKEHKIEEVMEDALKNNEFFIMYQPKIDLSTNKVVSVEALVRWGRENKVIMPNDFIPLFEKNRFIVKLDIYIFEKVCSDLKLLKNRNIDISASINVSKEHFIKENFINDYLDIAKRYNLPLKNLELEITESAFVDSQINLLKIMKDIKKEGFSLSLDDFGTGYSSLNMLQDMPIDVIKIDKSFVDQIQKENNKINLVKYIIKMSKDLKIKTVAEGVENKYQVDFLKKEGCDIIQGYFYSKPLSLEDLIKYINSQKIDSL